jgi:hypothetical protein
MLSRYDGRFAAAVPISGGVPASDFVAARLIDTPIFAFHSRDDASASVAATRGLINNILAADGQKLPTYLPLSDARDFMITNPSLPIHQAYSAEAHQFANVTDFFLSDPRMDLIYYERATGGHLGVLPAYNTREVYDWMFSHTTAVPEPATTPLLLIALTLLISAGRNKRPMRPSHMTNGRLTYRSSYCITELIQQCRHEAIFAPPNLYATNRMDFENYRKD